MLHYNIMDNSRQSIKMTAKSRKNIAKRSLVKLAFTHTPCMALAVIGGVLLPGILPEGIIHNIALEIPIVIFGAILGDYAGHRIFDTNCSHHTNGFKSFLKNFKTPSQILKTLSYSVISLAIHVLIFQAAHLEHGHL